MAMPMQTERSSSAAIPGSIGSRELPGILLAIRILGEDLTGPWEDGEPTHIGPQTRCGE